jgi:alkyl hydroperoxide reductase subunit AhpC
MQVHLAWIRTPRKKGGLGLMQIPLLADVDRRVSEAYGTLGAHNVPNRGIYLIDPTVRCAPAPVPTIELSCRELTTAHDVC